MSDVQLERSVLEAKERDELFAIAVALGTSPAARTKKADLVSHILQVTGVEADAAPAADKPRRPRARKPAAVPADSPVTDGSATQLELATETSTNGHAPQPVTEQFDQVAPVPAANGNGNANANGHGNGSQPGHAPATARAAPRPRPAITSPGTVPRGSSVPIRDASSDMTSMPVSATADAGGGATGRRRRGPPSASSRPSRPLKSRTRASSSRSRDFWTSARRATASCAQTVISPVRRTSTFR